MRKKHYQKKLCLGSGSSDNSKIVYLWIHEKGSIGSFWDARHPEKQQMKRKKIRSMDYVAQ